MCVDPIAVLILLAAVFGTGAALAAALIPEAKR